MKNHTNDCEVTTTGTCTCTEPHPPVRRWTHDDSCATWTGGICTCHVSKPKVRLTTADREDYRHRFGHEPTMRELYDWKQTKNATGRGKAGVVSKDDPNYQIPENARSMRAGTSRHVDTDPRVTWLGDQRLVHPLSCGVYKSPEPNWAPYCDCGIKLLQHRKIEPEVPETDPADFRKQFTSRAPWWVWSLIGFGAGFPLGAWAGWPSW